MPSIIPTITINGKSSTEINGLIIVSLPPISKPAMRAVSEEIDGRDGDEITKLGYSAYDKTIQIALAGSYDVNDVIRYFNQDGIIIFSNEPDKYYRFKQLEGIDFEKLIRFKTASVVFHCQPFKFSTTDEELTFFEPKSVSITNAGNIYSKPEIALTGHGNMEMGINGSPVLAIDFGDDQQTIIIDSEKMNAYGAKSNIKKLITEINAQQDLHGYDSAWIDSGDKAPYLFRKTAGTASRFGNGIFDQIVGGTVSWNQHCQIAQGALLENVATKTFNDGVWNFTATDLNSDSVGWYAEFSNKPNHVCFIACDVKPTNNVTMKLGMMDRDYFNVAGGVYSRIETIRTENVEARPVCYAMLNGLGLNSFSFECKNVNFIDLTQMLGSTIANYILSLEQATAGAGVAYFRKLFTKPYYEYNAGELKSVEAVAHKMIDFNQWDGLTESGYVYNGKLYSNNSYWRTANYIPVVSGEAYYFKTASTDGQINFFDAEKNFISAVDSMGGSARLATAPSGAKYVKFYQPNATDKNTVCVNISNPSLNGTYKQYHENVYPMDSSLELRGIPQIDANGNLSYDGDTYSSNGSVVRKYGIIDLYDVAWSKQITSYGAVRFYSGINISNLKPNSSTVVLPKARCSKYAGATANDGYSKSKDQCFAIDTDGNLSIYDSSLENLTNLQFKEYIRNQFLVYELASPTTETAEPFTNPQSIDANGSEEYIDGNVYGIVDLGTIEWGDASVGGTSVKAWARSNSLSSVIKTPDDNNKIANIYSTEFANETANNVYLGKNKSIGINTGGDITIYDTSLENMTGSQIASALSGKYLIYEKASSADVSIPVGHSTLHANICEISGWDSCDVKRTGKNMLPKFIEGTTTTNGITFAVDGDGVIRASGTPTGRANLFLVGAQQLLSGLKAGTYKISVGLEKTATYMMEFIVIQNGAVRYYSTLNSGSDVFTLNDGDYISTVYISVFADAGAVDLVFMPQLELGSEASDFEAYEGITKTISLGENTVFGGELDVATGILKITKAKKAVLSSMNFQTLSSWNKYAYYVGNFFEDAIQIVGDQTIAEITCNVSSIDTPARLASGTAQGIGQGGGANLFINLGCDKEGIKSICDSGFYVVYNLAEPIIVQCTAWEIMALIGENNIFANTGEISSCVYVKDGADVETSGEIITLDVDVGDIISDSLKNRLCIGNYDHIRLNIGSNLITFNPIEEGSEIDEMAISKYSRWL